jgi:hypothetical protein
MEPHADVQAPGAAVTVALCGHWGPRAAIPAGTAPCQRRRRRRRVARADPVRGRTGPRRQGRHLIEQGPSGQLKFPDGLTTPWQLRASWPSEISAEETGHAKLLIRS